jgi:hypothetical protein
MIFQPVLGSKLVIFQPVLGFAVRVRPQTRRPAPSFPRRRRFVRFSSPALPSFRLLAPPFFSLSSPRCCSGSLRQIRPGFAFPAARHSWGSDSLFLSAPLGSVLSSLRHAAAGLGPLATAPPAELSPTGAELLSTGLDFSGTKPPGTELLFAVWIRRFAAAGPSSSPSFGYQSGLAFSVLSLGDTGGHIPHHGWPQSLLAAVGAGHDPICFILTLVL